MRTSRKKKAKTQVTHIPKYEVGTLLAYKDRYVVEGQDTYVLGIIIEILTSTAIFNYQPAYKVLWSRADSTGFTSTYSEVYIQYYSKLVTEAFNAAKT